MGKSTGPSEQDPCYQCGPLEANHEPRQVGSRHALPGSVGDRTVGGFWSWGYSNVLTNNLRGVFAEFLVGTALGAVDGTRTEWDAFDVLYEGARINGGAKVEVKSSSYLQSWEQEKPSAISWSVGEHFALDPATNDWTPEKKRAADCYVFCVYTERDDRSPAKVLDPNRWAFYVVPTRVIDEELGSQKTVVLSRIESLTGPVPYSRLRKRVDEALAQG